MNKLYKKTMLCAMRTVFHGYEHSCDRDWVPLAVHPFDKYIAAAKLIIHVLLAKRVAQQLCGIHGHTLSINHIRALVYRATPHVDYTDR